MKKTYKLFLAELPHFPIASGNGRNTSRQGGLGQRRNVQFLEGAQPSSLSTEHNLPLYWEEVVLSLTLDSVMG